MICQKGAAAMTSFARECSSEIWGQSESLRPTAKAALLLATIAFSAAYQPAPLSAADPSRDVSGTWELLSNDASGTLTINQSTSVSRCNKLTGTLDTDDTGSIVGLYCLDDLHITFARFIDGEDSPFQMYEGYVSDDGQTMAGKFFFWASQGPSNRSTAPFVGER
jgi:hypothetical protein